VPKCEDVNLLDSLLDAIVRLEGEALVMHVGEKPYVVTTSASLTEPRGPLSWGQVELSSRVLTADAVLGMLGQILPLEQRQELEEIGAVEYEIPPPAGAEERFSVVAARGGDDVWLEVSRRRKRPAVQEAAPAPAATATDVPPWAAQMQDASAPAAAPVAPVAVSHAASSSPELIVEPELEIEEEEEEEEGEVFEISLDGMGAIASEVDAPSAPAIEVIPDIPQDALTEADVDALLAAMAPAAADATAAHAADAFDAAADGGEDEFVPVALDEPEEQIIEILEPPAVVEARATETPAPVEAPPAAETPEVTELPAVLEIAAVADTSAVAAAGEQPVVVEPAAVGEAPAEEAVSAKLDAIAEVRAVFDAFVLTPPESLAEEVAEEPSQAVAAAADASALAEVLPFDVQPEPDVAAVEESAVAETVGAPTIAEALPETADAPAAAVAETPGPIAEAPQPAIAEAPALVIAETPTPAIAETPAAATAEVVAAIAETLGLAAAAAALDSAAAVAATAPAEPPRAAETSPVAAAPAQEAPVVAVAAAATPVVDETPTAVAVPVATHPAVAVEAVRPVEVPRAAVEEPRPGVVVPISRSPVRPEAPVQPPAPSLAPLEHMLRIAAARGASTVYVVAQSKPMIRVDGEISLLESEATFSTADVERVVMDLAPARGRDVQAGAVEWMSDVPEVGRVRCVTFRDHRGPGVIFRMIPPRAISADQLGLTSEVQALCALPDGLVLVAGARASGKSTLLSAFVDLINRTRSDHVISIESQINFVHESRKSFVSQREVRGDAEAAAGAVRSAFREDPDVLVIEDLRTAEIVSVAIEAAESGRLVLGSLSAPSTVAAIERLVELFSPERRVQVQTALAGALRGVVAQVLLRKMKGGRIAAREVLLNTPAVSSLILEGRTFQLPVALEAGRRHGMVPLNDALAALVRDGTVHVAEAYRKALDRDALLVQLKRDGMDTAFAERLA
jgi:twitching motility protein PilT